MRLLILGAGGVDSTAALIAARRSFLTHVIVADSTWLALSVR
jgi:saccharopine dehydrogenase-like NADP-dependent oxidoreductase